MNWQVHKEYNGFECNAYQAIAATKLSSEAAQESEDTEDTEDAGCDSCIHYNNGECTTFKTNESKC